MSPLLVRRVGREKGRVHIHRYKLNHLTLVSSWPKPITLHLTPQTLPTFPLADVTRGAGLHPETRGMKQVPFISACIRMY